MRVVSLLPAATEIVAWLGATEHLVGITHECDFPPVITGRPRVTGSNVPVAGAAPAAGAHAESGASGAHAGTGHDAARLATPADVDAAVRNASNAGLPLFALDEGTIRALHPDVILTQALCDVCAVSENDVRALAARLDPPPHVVTLHGTTIEGILADIRTVAHALGVDDEADELIAGDLARLRTVHETLRDARAPRPRVLVIEWSEPVYLAAHWVPEMVRKAGGTNLLTDPGAHSTTVPMADCIAADPEIVLVAPCGYPLEAATAEAERLLAHPDWQWLRGRQLWAIDANGLVSRPGPRVVDGVEAMARIFNPDLFTALDPLHAQRLA